MEKLKGTRIKHNLNQHIGFRGDANMSRLIDELAAREGVARSALLRDIVTKGIKLRNSALYKSRLFD